MSLYDDAFDRAEHDHLYPREPRSIGHCYICGEPVYDGDGERDSDGAVHYDCAAAADEYEEDCHG